MGMVRSCCVTHLSRFWQAVVQVPSRPQQLFKSFFNQFFCRVHLKPAYGVKLSRQSSALRLAGSAIELMGSGCRVTHLPCVQQAVQFILWSETVASLICLASSRQFN